MQKPQYRYQRSNNNYEKQQPVYPPTPMDRSGAITRRQLHLRPIHTTSHREERAAPAEHYRASNYCTISEAGQLYINSEITARERLHDFNSAYLTYDEQHKILAVQFSREPPIGGDMAPVVPRKNATMIYIKPILNGIHLAPQFMLGRRVILFYDRTRDTKTFVILFGQPKM